MKAKELKATLFDKTLEQVSSLTKDEELRQEMLFRLTWATNDPVLLIGLHDPRTLDPHVEKAIERHEEKLDRRHWRRCTQTRCACRGRRNTKERCI